MGAGFSSPFSLSLFVSLSHLLKLGKALSLCAVPLYALLPLIFACFLTFAAS